MATATKKTRAARPVAGTTRAEPSVPGALEFLVHQERAARRVKDEAGRGRFEPGAVEERPLVAV
jgi:hypothetical protein